MDFLKKNGIWIALIVAILGFSQSVFNLQYSLFLAAWIAPLAMMRFIRNSKWWVSVVVGLIALQIAVMLGSLPFIGTAQEGVGMTFGETIHMMTKSGLILLAPNALIPFLLDKAFYKRLPPLAGSLIYPLSILVIDLIVTLKTGGMITIGETQAQSQTITAMTSLIGILGVGFLISWFASVMNLLLEKKGQLKEMGRLKWIYPLVMGLLFLYGALYTTFTQKSEEMVPIAGITSSTNIMANMGATDYSLHEFVDLSPEEYASIISSSEEDIERLMDKTRQAIEAGSEIIIWQEFAFHGSTERAAQVVAEMQDEARKGGVYILVSYGEVLSPEKRTDLPLRNISVMIDPQGNVLWEYAKTKVNPGYEDVIYEGGDGDIPYVDTPYGRVGVVICADGIYQHFIRQAYTKDIDLLLMPSWDSTTSTPKSPDCRAFRSVEFGFTSVQITGEGMSTVCDPYYRRWAQQNSFEPSTEELYMENFYANVPVFSTWTFFGSIGYWLQWLSFLALPALIIWAIVRGRKEKK